MSTRLKVSWIAALVVFVGALAVGAFGDSGPHSQQERVYEIAATLKCPQCAGETVAESDVAISREIRAQIAQGLQEGKTADEIRDEIAAGYDQEIRLTPSSKGVTGVIWILPVLFAFAAVAGLVVVVRRWSGRGAAQATDEDRRLVDEALQGRTPEEVASSGDDESGGHADHDEPAVHGDEGDGR